MYYLICERQLLRTHTHTLDNDNTPWFMGLSLINLWFFCHILPSLSLLLNLSICFCTRATGVNRCYHLGPEKKRQTTRLEHWSSNTVGFIRQQNISSRLHFFFLFCFVFLAEPVGWMFLPQMCTPTFKSLSVPGRLKAEKTRLFWWIK